MDREISESAERLADYVDRRDQHDFISSILSLLLYAIATDDITTSTDGLEHMLKYTRTSDEPNNSSLWGEFLSLSAVFFKRFKHDVWLRHRLVMILEELGDLPHAEDAFYVERSRTGAYLRISINV